MKVKNKINIQYSIFIILSIILLSFTEYDLNKNKEPNLVFNKKFYDFGVIETDTVLVAKFWLKNSGDSELNIINVDPDCMCTNFEILDNTIEPSDSTQLILFFNTENKIGKHKIYTILETNTVVRFYKLTLQVEIKR
jgi:hypothetical protein